MRRAPPAGSVRAVSSWTTPPPEGAEAADHHLHLPAGAHLSDRRGLTAAGAVTIALVLGLIGAVIDVRTGRGLRTTFAVLFVVGSGLAALLAHREDLRATVVMPPLTYCLLAVVGGYLGDSQAPGSFVKQNSLELASALITGAPVLFTATGVALAIALLRRARTPSGRA